MLYSLQEFSHKPAANMLIVLIPACLDWSHNELCKSDYRASACAPVFTLRLYSFILSPCHHAAVRPSSTSVCPLLHCRCSPCFPPLRPPSVSRPPYMLPRWHTHTTARLLHFNAFWLLLGKVIFFLFCKRGEECLKAVLWDILAQFCHVWSGSLW